MKKLWGKIQSWQNQRVLRKWPSRRKRGQLFWVISFGVLWALLMTLTFSIINYFDGKLFVSTILLEFSITFGLGLIVGMGIWDSSEKKYLQLIGLSDSEKEIDTN